jgi:hypothetical protein
MNRARFVPELTSGCTCVCGSKRMTTFPSLSTGHLLPRTCAHHTASQGACIIPRENSRPTSATCCQQRGGSGRERGSRVLVEHRCSVSAVWAVGTAGAGWQGVEHLFKHALENKRWAKVHLARAEVRWRRGTQVFESITPDVTQTDMCKEAEAPTARSPARIRKHTHACAGTHLARGTS